MAGSNRLTFLSNATGTGSYLSWSGGKMLLIVEGTFSTQTVKLQVKSPSGNAVDVTNSSLSAGGTALLELPPGEYRAVATATAVFAYGVSVPTKNQ